MGKGRGPFGGGSFGGGGSPFGGDAPKISGRIDTQVVPGMDNPAMGSGIEQRNVVPGAGGLPIIPLEVVPGAGTLPAAAAGPAQAVIHVTVFARYHRPEGEQLIKDIGYLHAASGNDFHLVLAGYSRDKPMSSGLTDPKLIQLGNGLAWYYDDAGFESQVRMVEEATTWNYGGGLQLVICDAMVSARRAANTREIFTGASGQLEHAIVVDVDEIKESKLFPDFERFFAALRTLIRDIQSKHSERLTWKLSDRLALTQQGVALKVIAKAFKLDFYEAFDSAKSLHSFAVRDLRRT